MQEFRKILSQYADIPKDNWAKFDVRDGGVSGESASSCCLGIVACCTGMFLCDNKSRPFRSGAQHVAISLQRQGAPRITPFQLQAALLGICRAAALVISVVRAMQHHRECPCKSLQMGGLRM
jgi:hypothetical protein